MNIKLVYTRVKCCSNSYVIFIISRYLPNYVIGTTRI